MSFVILLVVSNIVFLCFLQLSYLLVTRRRLKIYLLVEHLATLAKNGMPIHTGLRVVGRDLGGYLGTRVVRVAQWLEEGKSLGAAFEAAPRTFPTLLRSMLTLGDRSGNLAGFLEEMRRSYRRISDLPYQSLYLFLYPLLLSVGINVALAGLYAGIVPKFEMIFIQMNADPGPLMTWWPRLILANEVILVLCVVMILILVLGGSSVHFGTRIFRWLKALVDRVLLALPVLGSLVRDGATQQFSMCTGLFLRSGAALPEALRAAAEVERNGMLRQRLEKLARAVGEGERFSVALRNARIFEDDLLWFVETGETACLLPDHLLLAAVHYETKVRVAARIAARSVVPVFVLLNGAIVFGTFLLVFLPMQEILQSVIRRNS
jgi:type II secretory pathway component PulF